VVGPYEYTYRRGVDIDSYPIYGELHVYGGGGYIAELRGDRAAIYDKVAELKAGGWIDKYTRAVFLEFAVYNPNVCIERYDSFVRKAVVPCYNKTFLKNFTVARNHVCNEIKL